MKRYLPHPLAKLMPPMTDEEFAALKADIEKNGQREVIYLYEGKVIDGVHRLRACRELGIPPLVSDLVVDDPLSWVVSRNMKRRHLTVKQRVQLAVELLPELEKVAKERMRDGGRAKVAPNGATLGKASAHAAKLVGVGTRSVERAKHKRAVEKYTNQVARNVRRAKAKGLSRKEVMAVAREGVTIPAGISNEEAIRVVQVEAGATAEGRRRIFESRTIRTIRMAYGIAEAREMIAWLKEVMLVTTTKNPSEAMLALKRDLWPRLKRRMPARTRGHLRGHPTPTP